MGVCCANRREFVVSSNGASQGQKLESRKQNVIIKTEFPSHYEEPKQNDDVINAAETKLSSNLNSEFLAQLNELEKKPADKRKICSVSNEINNQKTPLINNSAVEISEKEEESGIMSINKSEKKVKGVSKNYLKTSTIKHNKSDFNVKAKVNKGDESLQNLYQSICKLGKGSFGTVFKVSHKSTGQIRALKLIKKENIQLQDDEQQFLKEIEILMKIDHMNIIKIYEFFEDDLNYYIITEYVSQGELLENVVRFPNFDENFIKRTMRQIMSAVTYLHKLNITHRDLKPENILVASISDSDLEIKIIDFGTSNYVKKNKNLKLKVGSPYYIAPEVLQGSYNEKCDVWSCGVIMYVLLVGYQPFTADSTNDLFNVIKKGYFEMTGFEWDAVSEQAKDLIKKMLTKNFHNRISSQKCLEHEWLAILDKQVVSNKDMKVCVKNLTKMQRQDKLQQATIAYIVHFLTPSTELEQLKETFRALDKNGDGTLCIDEINAGYEKLFGPIASDVELKKVLEEIDMDGDGTVSYEEFLSIVMNKAKLINEKNLKLCFEAFDENKDNKLSAEEIRRALGAKDNDYVKELISLIDKNNNSEIDYEEFKELMNLLIKHK